MFLSVQYDFAGLVIRMYFLNHFDNFAGVEAQPYNMLHVEEMQNVVKYVLYSTQD